MTVLHVTGDSTWPLPDERLGEVEWQLRYGEPTTGDRMVAASVLAAYREIICGNRRHAERSLHDLRTAMKKVPHGR